MFIMEQLCRQVPNGHCGRSGQCWTDSWKWAFLQSQSAQLAAWGWARDLQSSLTTPLSCLCSNPVLATLDTPWLLAFPPNPSAEWGSSSRPAGHFPLCSLSRWPVGLAETRPFSLFRSFCLQWFAILHNLTKPLLFHHCSVCPLLSPCRHSTDNVPFTVVMSLLPLKQVPAEMFPTLHELSLVTLVSSPQPALNRLPFLPVCTASVWAFWSFTWQDVY